MIHNKLPTKELLYINRVYSLFYPRVTVDGLRADISLKRTCTKIDWCIESGRLNARLASSGNTNSYLDDVYAKLLNCHKQLHFENILVTAQAIKLRYLGKDKTIETLKELIP